MWPLWFRPHRLLIGIRQETDEKDFTLHIDPVFFAFDEITLETYIQPDRLEFVFRPRTLFPTDCRAYVVGIGIARPNDPEIPPADWNPNR